MRYCVGMGHVVIRILNTFQDLMLFCDACDKGYHMTCHEPPLMNKPKGSLIYILSRTGEMF